MKQIIKTTFLLLTLLLPATSVAYDFEVDGIYYNINGNEATVTCKNYSNYDFFSDYSGDVTIPNTVTYEGSTYTVTCIGEGAFYGCIGLTSVTIPNSVTTISHAAFFNSGLTSVTIPNSVISIGKDAFSLCPMLTDVYIPNSVTTIGDLAFEGSYGLTSITIPNSVTSIGYGAFSGCSGLTSINIPNSVSFIGDAAFAICCLTNIVVENGNPKYDSRDNCNAIIETASNKLIAGCQSTVIPNSVTSIGRYAFDGCCGLTKVTIPNSVTCIDSYAFDYCDELNDVYCYIINPSIISMGSSVFSRSSSNYAGRTLHVPIGSLEAYQTDTKWSQYFSSIVEMDPVLAEYIELDKNSAVVNEGETLLLTATVLPDETTDKTVMWASSNPRVATVSSDGLVTALSVGCATITTSTLDGSNLSASCNVTVTSLSASECLSLSDVSVLHGDTIVIPVRMNNEETIMAFQTDIYLPDGFGLVTDEDDEFIITPSDRLTSDHVLMTNRTSDGAVRLVCYTPTAQVIDGNEGDLFYITVAVSDAAAAGDYVINLRNSRLTKSDYTEIRIPDAAGVINVQTYIPGDVNDSHTVTVTDIVITAQYIIELHPEPFIFDAADMNGDGEVTVTDIMLIARLILYPTMKASRQVPALTTNDDRMSGDAVTISVGETRRVSVLLDNAMAYSAFQFDLNLPDGLTASNFALTERTDSHVLDVNTLTNDDIRVLCYSPAIEAIDGNCGAMLTFDVTASTPVVGEITVDGIELVTTACQTVRLGAFTICVNNVTTVNELVAGKTIERVEYFNIAGQQLTKPAAGVNIVVTTYADGTRTTAKIIQ